MIRANMIGSSAGGPVNSGEYVEAYYHRAGTLTNDTFSFDNGIWDCVIIGIQDYTGITGSTQSNNHAIVVFNDVSDATSLSPLSSTSQDITNYNYLMVVQYSGTGTITLS